MVRAEAAQQAMHQVQAPAAPDRAPPLAPAPVQAARRAAAERSQARQEVTTLEMLEWISRSTIETTSVRRADEVERHRLAIEALAGPLPKFATGGAVTGPGSGTSDSIPAMLSHGEFVIRAEAAQRNRALLEAVNSGQVEKFARGGFVGSDRGVQTLAGRHDLPAVREVDKSARESGGRRPVPVQVTITGAAGNSEVRAIVASGIAQGLREYEAGEDGRQARRQITGGNDR